MTDTPRPSRPDPADPPTRSGVHGLFLGEPAGAPAPAPGFMRWANGWRATVLLVLGVTVLRLVYLAWLCPYSLVEDEAHYWEWSRHLDLSYYSKGPGIAWTIALTTELFGDTEFGVRCAAAVFGGVLAGIVAWMGWLVSRDRRAAFIAAVIVLLTPAYMGVSILMTIDGPFLACWAAASWGAFAALRRGSRAGWVLLGGAIAIGFLYKYTILLIVPGIVLYALWHRGRLRVAPRVWAWAGLGLGLALLGLLPVAIWNAQHDWVTIKHLLGHLGMKGGDLAPRAPGTSKPWSPIWTLEYLGVQLAMGGAAPIVAFGTMLHLRKHRLVSDATWSDLMLLLLVGLPVLVFYFAVSFFTRPEGNWPIAAYVTLAPIAAIGFVDGLSRHRTQRLAWLALPKPRPRAGVVRRAPETPIQVLWHVVIGTGVVVALVLPRMDLWARLPYADRVLPVGRLTRAEPMAEAVRERLKIMTRSRSREPFIMTDHYGRASLLAFYLPGHPVVYCSSAHMPAMPERGLAGGRASQYDQWPATSIADPGTHAELLGRPGVLVGGSLPQWETAFAQVRELERHPRRDIPPILVGTAYRGFATSRPEPDPEP
ncbi:MAG: ArnT family glycosyltransferase [Phycisphaerales bacterium JB037]